MDDAQNVEILLVEDAKFFRSVIKSQIEKQLGFKVTCAETYQEACTILDERSEDFFLALLDLNLPDAPKGEIVDYVMGKSVPSIVFSGQFSEDLRDHLLKQNIIDYVVKDSPASIEYVISTVKRLYHNQKVKVLLTDDSKSARYQMHGLLARYKFQVLEAEDGLEALKILDENPDIMLVITDYNMPNLDGFELTKKIRTHYSKRQICIIGVSTYGNHALSAKFIKVGANDFITKPFLNEEFFCRVSQNIEMLEHIKALEDSLITDYLTGLRNRRYLFERGQVMLQDVKDNGGYLVGAMCDIDFFKRINDTYGHDGGDEALKHVSNKLRSYFGNKGVVARFGGEEFCILLQTNSLDDLEADFEALRKGIEETSVSYGNREIKTTLSIGVSWQKVGQLEDLLNIADGHLYTAKETGRNKVVMDS
ncbi:diguanylate cyclase [Terasakiella sp. A23]|uniref:diguanylate cyclase n=1 Tax=Terasakiella sp. FCG-A23 TaxID=3080561 RepID=UPI00295565FA|nr:diguanylate cyclase [Terasakiella sp. A23]MDV7338075.1 diguanylate cyclase [Terasakiella sp. A23]